MKWDINIKAPAIQYNMLILAPNDFTSEKRQHPFMMGVLASLSLIGEGGAHYPFLYAVMVYSNVGKSMYIAQPFTW